MFFEWGSLAFLNHQNVFNRHPHGCVGQLVPVYCWVSLHTITNHHCFVHSYVGAHLGCSRCGPLSMKLLWMFFYLSFGGHIFSLLLHKWEWNPESKGRCVFNLINCPHNFLYWLYHLSVWTGMWEFMSLHIFSNIWYYKIYFHFSHSNKFEVTSHRCYNFTFLMTNDVEHTFQCLLVIFVFSFMKWLFKIFAHFKIGFSFYYFIRYFYIFVDRCHLSDILQIFFPFWDLF